MTQDWISQVVSNLSSMHNEIIDTVLHRKLLIKSWYNSKYNCKNS